jgi:hypothetical protein
MVLYPAVSLVSIAPEGAHDHSARDALALAQGRLSQLLAFEISSTGRSATNRDGAARADPADGHREPTLGRAADPHPLCRAGQQMGFATKIGYSLVLMPVIVTRRDVD